jgi:hypothetical protein
MANVPKLAQLGTTHWVRPWAARLRSGFLLARWRRDSALPAEPHDQHRHRAIFPRSRTDRWPRPENFAARLCGGGGRCRTGVAVGLERCHRHSRWRSWSGPHGTRRGRGRRDTRARRDLALWLARGALGRARYFANRSRRIARAGQFGTKIASISVRTFSSVCRRATAISFTMSDRAVSSIRRSPKLSCLSVFSR